MSSPFYTQYKESGVQWLGGIPEHWKVRRLKEVGVLKGGAGFPPDLQDVAGEELPFYKVGDLKASTDGRLMTTPEHTISKEIALKLRAAIIPKDSILYAKIGAALSLNRRRVTFGNCCIDNNMTAYIPQKKFIQTSWAFYWLSSLDFSTFKNPGAVPSFSEGDQGVLPILVPPISEQTQIAAFLDNETAKIDQLIAEQRRLMELLKEKRQAVISNAVSKGLNPRAPMKLSGAEWLGNVPAHWHRTRIKRTARAGTKTFVDGDWIESPYITTEGVRLLQCGNVGTGVFEEQGFRYISEKSFASFDCTEVEPGNVLICRLQSSRTILAGRACLAPNLGAKMITSVDNCILKPSADFDPRYIVYQLSTAEYLSFIEVVARGGTRDRVSRSMLGNIDLVAPPVKEQIEIADFLEFETTKFEALTAEAQCAIDLLQERRTALIFAAVTGQIDVRQQPGI